MNEFSYSVASVALSFLIYHRTGSAIGAAAFYLSTQFVPSLFSSMVVARVDQLSVRLVLFLLYGVESILYLILAWLARRFSLAPVLVLTTVDGILAVSARSIGRAATVRVTSSAGLLREGNALANVMFMTGVMLGPTIGGAVVAASSASVALLLNAGLFVVVALMLATAAGLPGPAAQRAPRARRVRAALAYAKQHPTLRALLSLQAAALVFFTISMPVEVVYAQRSLHAGAAGYGLLLSAWGAGAVAGGAIFMRWRAVSMRLLLAGGTGLLGVGFLVLAVAPLLGIAIVGAALAGVGNGIEAVAARTAVQEATEERWMALIMSFNESLAMFVPGIGIVIGGAITELASPRVAWATASAGALAVTAAVWVVLGQVRRRSAPAAARPQRGSVTAAAPPQRDCAAPRASPSSAAPPV